MAGLSNPTAMMRLMQNDLATANRLKDAGCTPPEGRNNSGGSISEAFAAGCPAEKVEFSRQALAELERQQAEVVNGRGASQAEGGR